MRVHPNVTRVGGARTRAKESWDGEEACVGGRRAVRTQGAVARRLIEFPDRNIVPKILFAS
jgi:hypothetical protein